jgi:hypothetical protein
MAATAQRLKVGEGSPTVVATKRPLAASQRAPLAGQLLFPPPRMGNDLVSCGGMPRPPLHSRCSAETDVQPSTSGRVRFRAANSHMFFGPITVEAHRTAATEPARRPHRAGLRLLSSASCPSRRRLLALESGNSYPQRRVRTPGLGLDHPETTHVLRPTRVIQIDCSGRPCSFGPGPPRELRGARGKRQTGNRMSAQSVLGTWACWPRLPLTSFAGAVEAGCGYFVGSERSRFSTEGPPDDVARPTPGALDRTLRVGRVGALVRPSRPWG